MTAGALGSMLAEGKSKFSAKFNFAPAKNAGLGNIGAFSSITWAKVKRWILTQSFGSTSDL